MRRPSESSACRRDWSSLAGSLAAEQQCRSLGRLRLDSARWAAAIWLAAKFCAIFSQRERGEAKEEEEIELKRVALGRTRSRPALLFGPLLISARLTTGRRLERANIVQLFFLLFLSLLICSFDQSRLERASKLICNQSIRVHTESRQLVRPARLRAVAVPTARGNLASCALLIAGCKSAPVAGLQLFKVRLMIGRAGRSPACLPACCWPAGRPTRERVCVFARARDKNTCYSLLCAARR